MKTQYIIGRKFSHGRKMYFTGKGKPYTSCADYAIKFKSEEDALNNKRNKLDNIYIIN